MGLLPSLATLSLNISGNSSDSYTQRENYRELSPIVPRGEDEERAQEPFNTDEEGEEEDEDEDEAEQEDEDEDEAEQEAEQSQQEAEEAEEGEQAQPEAEEAEEGEQAEQAEEAEPAEPAEQAKQKRARIQNTKMLTFPPKSSDWLTKKSADKFRLQPIWRQAHQMDFVFENPLHGKFWNSNAYKLLFRRADNGLQVLTKNSPTSYCHYGKNFQKKTNFFSSLVDLKLKRPCPAHPCVFQKANQTHELVATEQSQETRNSVPFGITETVIATWQEKIARRRSSDPKIEHLLFVDAFAGFGSVANAATEISRTDPRIFVVQNDFCKSRNGLNFDLSKPNEFEIFMLFAVQALVRARNIKRDPTDTGLLPKNIALLLWLSTPCKTYSLQAVYHHRGRGKLTDLAENNDKMNLLIANWVDREMLRGGAGAAGPSGRS